MKVWLVTIGEPIPTDPGDQRLHRTGLFAELLSGRGHSVTWWTSTFDHVRKINRYDSNHSFDWSANARIELVFGPEYKRNVCMQRFINHRKVAKNFARRIQKEAPPDIIVCAMPTLELSEACTAYGQLRDIPVILDMRDMWPDIFLDLAPPRLEWAARIGLAPLFRSLTRSTRAATAIWGITPEFMRWGLHYAGRTATPADAGFWLAYPNTSLTAVETSQSIRFWDARGVTRDPQVFRVCYFGVFSAKLERDTLLDAARLLESQHPKRFQFVLCGNGDDLPAWKRLAGNNVIFPGWVGKNEIAGLMRVSQMGVAPLKSRRDFVISIPNKAVEYLAGGLPVLSCLKGSLKALIENERCGVYYEEGDPVRLADKLKDLARDRCTIDNLSQKAQAVFQKDFTTDNVYGRMADKLEWIATTFFKTPQPVTTHHRQELCLE